MKNTASLYAVLGLAFALFITTFGVFTFLNRENVAHGAATQGQEYQATSTAANSLFGAQTGSQLLKTGYGSLGTVVLLGANTGIVNFYNATTTNVLLRTGNKATTTIFITSLPASLAAGSYVFDISFSDGLYMDLNTGSMPTSTVTWR